MKAQKIIMFVAAFSSTIFMSVAKGREEWKLVWEEEFEGLLLDSTVWSRIPRSNGADWCRYMSDADTCYSMRNGNLVLRGLYNTDCLADTARYITGGVYTKGKKSFAQGRLEIRARLGEARGAWPAFWLLPVEGAWPKGGEIDIMEHLNHDSIAYQTVHSYYTFNLKQDMTPPHSATGRIKRNDYNVYAVELHTDSLCFFVNGERTFSYPRIQTELEGQFPFDRPFYLLLDMQLGGSWVGRVFPEDLPVEMDIDWVRFYERD